MSIIRDGKNLVGGERDGKALKAVYYGAKQVWSAEVAPPVGAQAVYVTDIAGLLGATSDVVHFPAGGPFTSPVSLGISVSAPIGVACVSDGTVYVIDNPVVFGQSGSPQVYRWDGTTQSTVPLTGLGTPSGVAVDADGVLYVADQTEKKVYRYDGTTQSTVPLTGLGGPLGVAVDADGVLYVGGGTDKQVYRWDGTTQSTVPLTGLGTPSGVAVDADGVLYVADIGTFTIVTYDGTTQSSFGPGISGGHPYYAIAVGPAQT